MMIGKYTENKRSLIEAMIDLFIIFPNPQCKGDRNKIMKIAFDVLEKRLQEDLEKDKEENTLSDKEILIREEYYKILFDKE